MEMLRYGGRWLLVVLLEGRERLKGKEKGNGGNQLRPERFTALILPVEVAYPWQHASNTITLFFPFFLPWAMKHIHITLDLPLTPCLRLLIVENTEVCVWLRVCLFPFLYIGRDMNLISYIHQLKQTMMWGQFWNIKQAKLKKKKKEIIRSGWRQRQDK